MSSRHSAARPKRAGETFARTHHHDHLDEGGHDSKKLKFDVRNPSALAPDAPEEDAILDADVIGGGGGATKRGAVNLDGYDSDSDNERNFKSRAEERHRGKKKGDATNFLDQLDSYDVKGSGAKGGEVNEVNKDEEDEDMFAADDDEDQESKATQEAIKEKGKKDKAVRFLEDEQIVGQDLKSKSGGQIRLDDEESSDDEADKDLAIQEEGVDEEVGLGGLKRNAPKVEAFNMKEEQEEGRFDEDGNYIRKAADPNAVHDKWLEGLSKKDMRKAAAAHEKREAEARRLRMENDDILTTDLLKALIVRLERGETPLEALARLGKGQTKPKKIPKWKLKKHQSKGGESMDVDREKEISPDQARRKEAIEAITDAADKLLSRDHAEIYDEERELLVRQWQRETGEEWVDPAQEETNAQQETSDKLWEFRWTDGRDGAEKQGPFDGPTMKAWQDAGYFGEGVEFRSVGEDDWSRVATFV